MTQTTTNARERRTRTNGEVAYATGSGLRGRAAWRDVSRTGASLAINQEVRPGTMLRLSFNSPLEPHRRHELAARVAWCRQRPDSREFLAGIEVRRDAPEAALAFAALGYSLRTKLNEMASNWVGTQRWTTLEAAGAAEHAQAAQETAWQAV